MQVGAVARTDDEQQARVLLVDDDPFLAQLLCGLLASEGYAIETVPTGKEAIEAPKSGLDLVILDLMLPDMSGHEVCRFLKSDPQSQHIPIIMLTARADTRDKVGGLKAGADDYITKPFDVDELVARVEAMLRVKRGEDALRERNRDMATLLEASRVLSLSLELPQVVRQVLEMVRTAVPEAVAGAVLLYSESDKALRVEAAWGSEKVPWLGREVPAGEGCIGRSYLLGKAIVDSTENLLPRSGPAESNTLAGQVDPPPGSLDVWCTPISHQDHSTGVIALFGMHTTLPVARRGALIEAIAAQAGLAIQNAGLFKHIRGMFQSSIQLLAAAIDARDPSTHSHSQDVSRYSRSIAEALGLPPSEVELIGRAALVHDIGKIGVVDSILGKPGPLNPMEQVAMMAHPRIGASILERMPDLAELVPIVRHHHERYDGRGYPDGLAGEQIPLGARILAVADAFEAMTSNRPYRSRRSVGRAVETLLAGRGTQFDPHIVDVFVRTLDSLIDGQLTRREAPADLTSTGPIDGQHVGESQVREVALIYDIFRDARVILDLQELTERVSSVLGQQIPSCQFFVELVDPTQACGPRAVDEPLSGEGDVGYAERTDPAIEERLYPLSLDGQVRAVLHARPRGFARISDEDSRLLRNVAPQLALIIDAGVLHNRACADAAHDPLTGLYTRRYLRERLEEEAARAQRQKNLMAICLIDVNGLEETVSKRGQEIGNDMLSTVAQALKSSTRTSDLAARYASDEFALVVTEADTEGLNRALRRFEARLADLVRQKAERWGDTVNVSVSYGIVGFPGDGRRPGQLLERAERRLMKAKRQRVGRSSPDTA